MTHQKKAKIKVFIVDDDNLLIDGLARFFKDSNKFEYVDRANTPDECLQKLKKKIKNIDIILMDVIFSGMEKDGIQLAEEIRQVYPDKIPRIAFMSISNKAIVDAKKGFHGLIPKNQGIKELMKMLEDIYYKGTVFPLPITDQTNFFNRLTQMQKKILCLTIREENTQKIANTLHITTDTVASHQKVIISIIKQFGLNINTLNHGKVKALAKKFKLCAQLKI